MNIKELVIQKCREAHRSNCQLNRPVGIGHSITIPEDEYRELQFRLKYEDNYENTPILIYGIEVKEKSNGN